MLLTSDEEEHERTCEAQTRFAGTRAGRWIANVGSEALLSLDPLHGKRMDGRTEKQRRGEKWEGEDELCVQPPRWRDVSYIERGRPSLSDSIC